MNITEKLVIDILEHLLSEDKRHRISLDSDLRKDLGLNSLKLVDFFLNCKGKQISI